MDEREYSDPKFLRALLFSTAMFLNTGAISKKEKKFVEKEKDALKKKIKLTLSKTTHLITDKYDSISGGSAVDLK